MSARGYWWLVAKEAGQTVLIFGSDRSEEDARQKGLDMLGGRDFEVKRLRTRNMARASAMLRGHKLEGSHSLSDAMERQVHEKGLRRLRHRRTPKPPPPPGLW